MNYMSSETGQMLRYPLTKTSKYCPHVLQAVSVKFSWDDSLKKSLLYQPARSILLYMLLMEMFDCIYYKLALNFDLMLTQQQLCKFIQNSQIVNNVFTKDFALLELHVACSR